MATSSTTNLSHVAIAESVFNELVSGHDSYYYYYGRNLPFESATVEDVSTTQLYEQQLRRSLVLLKKVNANDVAHCAPRYSWISGEVYDMYDDNYYGGKVTTISVANGGQNYSQNTVVLIESPIDGITAIGEPFIINGVLQYVAIKEPGSGYTSAPYVSIIDDTGTGAICTSEISETNLSYSGAATLKNSKFYVLNSSYNVYKCLFNADNNPSTVEPTSTSAAPFTTADGYIWKFLYNIPNTLQKKWLTTKYMPVTKQLTNSYYSNGGIDNVTILNGGSGYTYGQSTNAYIVGDGVGAVLRPIVSDTSSSITSVEILNGGSGYATTTSKVIKSFVRTSNVVKCTTYIDHKMVNGTTVTISGSSGFDGTYTVLYSPGTDLPTEFRFASVGADTTKDYGTISFTNANKTITSISRQNNVVTVVTSTAHGLTVGTIVTISGVTGTPQSELNGSYNITEVVNTTTFKYSLTGLNCSASSGTVQFNSVGIANIQLSGTNLVTVTCAGKHNRTSGNTVTINSNDTNFGNGTSYTITVVSPTVFTYAKSGTNATTTSPTLTYNTGIVVKSGSGTGKYGNSTAVLTPGIYAGAIDNVGIVDPGTGYASGNDVTLTISGDNVGGTNASISAIVGQDGTIQSTIINSAGSGYTYANISVASSSGTGAKLVATTNKGNPDTLQYLTEIQAIPGAIYAGRIISGGVGYTNATVTIDGDGTGATATLTVASGVIVGITFTNPGSGYTYANLTIVGDGSGAEARAILPPPGGHGSNCIHELFASNLIFFSNLSDNDIINDVLAQNEYRQYGIIKNPKYFDSTIKYNQNIGTTVYTITGTFLATDYPNDSVMKITTGGKDYTFHVVQAINNKMLIIPLDNYIPQVGDIIIKTTDVSKNFTIASVINPDIDKHSGDIMYINNSTAFSQSPSQVIKQRTILTF